MYAMHAVFVMNGKLLKFCRNLPDCQEFINSMGYGIDTFEAISTHLSYVFLLSSARIEHKLKKNSI